MAVAQLGDKTAQVVPYAARYHQLATRLGIDFGAVLAALSGLPLAHDGARHKALRRATAQYLGAARNRLQGELQDIVARSLAPLACANTCDAMRDIVVPLTDRLLDHLCDGHVTLPDDNLMSRVFSKDMGVARRKRLNDQCADLQAQLTAITDNDVDVQTKMTLQVLGRDALIGTIARSLYGFFVSLDGAALSSRPFQAVPTHTGVPYIDRLTEEGEVRCMLQSLDDSPVEEDRLGFFGRGAHLCLGRAITLDLFSEIADWISRQDTCVRVEQYQMRKDDVFLLPDVFRIAVCPSRPLTT